MSGATAAPHINTGKAPGTTLTATARTATITKEAP
jgi:hypothetical protein